MVDDVQIIRWPTILVDYEFLVYPGVRYYDWWLMVNEEDLRWFYNYDCSDQCYNNGDDDSGSNDDWWLTVMTMVMIQVNMMMMVTNDSFIYKDT